MQDRFRIRTIAAVAPVMIGGALVATLPAAAQQVSRPPESATLERIYGNGTDFATFLTDAVRRKALWDANWAKSDPGDEFVARAAALEGRYRILAVAIDSCSDSVNTIPYIARLVSRLPQLELQIVNPDVGRLLMDTYRTPDGRGATPTVVILDERYEVVGAWVERPSPLQDWWVGHPEISDAEKARRKQGWYDWDEGYSTYAELVAMLEAAESHR